MMMHKLRCTVKYYNTLYLIFLSEGCINHAMRHSLFFLIRIGNQNSNRTLRYNRAIQLLHFIMRYVIPYEQLQKTIFSAKFIYNIPTCCIFPRISTKFLLQLEFKSYVNKNLLTYICITDFYISLRDTKRQI